MKNVPQIHELILLTHVPTLGKDSFPIYGSVSRVISFNEDTDEWRVSIIVPYLAEPDTVNATRREVLLKGSGSTFALVRKDNA